MKNKSEEEKEKAIQKMKNEETEKQLAERDGDLKNTQLQGECLEQYKRDMRKELSASDNYFNQTDLNAIHETARGSALSKVVHSGDLDRNRFYYCYFVLFCRNSLIENETFAEQICR